MKDTQRQGNTARAEMNACVYLRKGHRHSRQARQPLAPVDLELLLASLFLQALPSPLYQCSPATTIRHKHSQGGE